MDVTLGIDTSCYTTSVAAIDMSGRLIADVRIPLEVKPGGTGLAQSEMVFQHVRNLPVVMELLRRSMGSDARIVAIGVSAKPRSVECSYMPVFLVGLGTARSLGMAMGCPVYEISHQQNHLLAGLWSAEMSLQQEFLAIHASGGTTELLRVQPGLAGLQVELLGGTRDLNAGQFIDRIGVALGLPFPAGPQLENLAEQADESFLPIPVSVKGLQISFSGPETHVRRWLARSPDSASVAASVQHCVAESLLRVLVVAAELTAIDRVLIVGGVGANRFIRNYLAKGLNCRRQISVVWPESRFSGDNATGAAWWAALQKAV
jgi:N6-L-threonylcarbamoyladenine synthase